MQKKDNELDSFGAYQQAVVCNGFCFVSGQTAVNPKTKEPILEPRLAIGHILSNLDTVLKDAGTSLNNAIKVTVYLTNVKDFDQLNEIYKLYFKEPYPARCCIGVKELPFGSIIALDCIAKM